MFEPSRNQAADIDLEQASLELTRVSVLLLLLLLPPLASRVEDHGLERHDVLGARQMVHQHLYLAVVATTLLGHRDDLW